MNAATLKFFSDPHVLRRVSRPLLTEFFERFTDLLPSKYFLPKPRPDNEAYFGCLAEVLARTSELPEGLARALFEVEALTDEDRDFDPQNTDGTPIFQAIESWLRSHPTDVWANGTPESSDIPHSTSASEHSPQIYGDCDQTASSPQPSPPEAEREKTHSEVLSPEPYPMNAAYLDTAARNAKEPLTPALSPSEGEREIVPVSRCANADKDGFARLAQLSAADYDRCRKAEAKRLGIRVETLDSEVAKHRQLSDEAAALHSALSSLQSPLVWPEPVDGAQVLDQVAARFSFYVKLPSGAADALALWAAHAHAFAAFPLSPRLNLSSSESGCGKTTTLDLLAAMTPRPLRTESLTAPVLFRLVDQQQPTLLLDEVDTFLPQDEELRGLLNAGHKRGGCAYRCEGSNNAVRAFKAFAPAVLSGIGPLPATLHDRSICIYLLKAEEDEVTAHFNELKAEIETELCRKLARWTQDNFGAIQACDPPIPKAAFNRLGDNWRPLFAIAQIAGDDWPERVLSAFTQLSSPSKASAPQDVTENWKAKERQRVKTASSPRPSGFPTPPQDGCPNHEDRFAERGPPEEEREKSFQMRSQTSGLEEERGKAAMEAPWSHNSLLGDIRDIFARSGVSRISSKQLVDALGALPERPDYSALCNPRSACRWLALRLAPFGIHPHNIQVEGRQSKGYDVRDFATAFSQLTSPRLQENASLSGLSAAKSDDGGCVGEKDQKTANY